MSSVIRRQDALIAMEDRSRPFTLEYVTLDEKRNTGGQLKKLVNCELTGSSINLSEMMMRNIRQIGIPNDHPHPVHIHLITRYNNMLLV